MRSRRAAPPTDDDRWAKVTAHVAALEDRIRLLEAKILDLSAAARKQEGADATAAARTTRRAARARPRPRCPGCTLELPKGRTGDYCVWCGFMLTAVAGRNFR